MNEQFTVTETTETAWKDTSESVEVVIPNDTNLESNEDATSFVMSEEAKPTTDALQELSEEDRIRINAETYDAMVTGEEIAEFTADTNISSSEILNEIEKTYGVKLDVSDVLNLIEIKDRLTSKSPGQIVNAYAEMPRGIQGIIKSTYAEIYPDIDEKSPESIPVLNYLAREFILNLYSSTEMGQFIAEYTEAMSDIQNRTGSENIMTDALRMLMKMNVLSFRLNTMNSKILTRKKQKRLRVRLKESAELIRILKTPSAIQESFRKLRKDRQSLTVHIRMRNTIQRLVWISIQNSAAKIQMSR